MSVERNGAWQEYLVIDAREAAKLPDEMSFTDSRSVSLCRRDILEGHNAM